MKYNYTTEGYHPRNVTFEVSAMLMDEEPLPASTKVEAHQTNYARDGYARDQELSFNAVTDKAATVKYLHQKHNHAALHYYIEKLKKEIARAKTQKDIARAAFLATAHSLSEVVQAMLTKFNLVKHMFKHGKDAPKTMLDVNKINHILYATHHVKNIEKEQAKSQVQVKTSYALHPHVDAILRERAQTHSLGLYR